MDIITTDGSALVGRRAVNDALNDCNFPNITNIKRAIRPTYRSNDSEWADVVNWTVYATIIADEYGVTSANVGLLTRTHFQNLEDYLANDGVLQTKMGLVADAFYNVIKQVGNYD